MTEQQPKRRREDGRPRKTPEGSVRISVSMPKEMQADFKRLGGSIWLQEQIRKAIENQ